MDPKAPIEWEELESVRSSPQLREIFEEHRDAAAAEPTMEAAVDRLYRIRRREYDVAAPDQGVAYVFAYLLESADVFEPSRAFASRDSVAASLRSRRPDTSTLEDLFWEREQVPWWIAVQYGVHYSLVQYWLWEDGIPLMRRNVPDSQFEQLELDITDSE